MMILPCISLSKQHILQHKLYQNISHFLYISQIFQATWTIGIWQNRSYLPTLRRLVSIHIIYVSFHLSKYDECCWILQIFYFPVGCKQCQPVSFGTTHFHMKSLSLVCLIGCLFWIKFLSTKFTLDAQRSLISPLLPTSEHAKGQ